MDMDLDLGLNKKGTFPDQSSQRLKWMNAFHCSLKNVREVEGKGLCILKVWSSEGKYWEWDTSRGKGKEWCYLNLVLQKQIWRSFWGSVVVCSSSPSPVNGPWSPDLAPSLPTHFWVFSKGAAPWEKRTGLWTSILHCTTQNCMSSKGATETSFQNIW